MDVMSKTSSRIFIYDSTGRPTPLMALTRAKSTSLTALSWSSDGSLAVVNGRGVLVYTLLPNPAFPMPKINFEQKLIEATTEKNPHLVKGIACE